MADPIITEEDMNDALRKLASKYGDDFRRLSKADRLAMARNVLVNLPLAFTGQRVEMERPTMGYDEAYVRQQQSRDNDMARLDILAKHKKQLMKLEEAGMRGSTQHKMAEAQALRSLAMIDISRNTSLTAMQKARIEQRTAFYTAQYTSGMAKQDEIRKKEDAGAKRARNALNNTIGKEAAQLEKQMNEDMASLANDPYAQQAYIRGMTELHGETAGDVLATLVSDAQAEEVNVPANVRGKDTKEQRNVTKEATTTTAPTVKGYKQALEAIEREKELAEEQATDALNGMSNLSASFGFDDGVKNLIISRVGHLMGSAPETDVSKSKSVGTIAGDLVESEYGRLKREQKKADAERSPMYWAEIEALINNSPDFTAAYKLKGEPYGKTKLEFFKELMKADKKLDKEERTLKEKEEGLSKGIERAERVAAGDALNASAVERLVARMRVGLSKVGRYIAGDESGRSEELDEELLDLPPAPEAEEAEEVAPEDLPSEARGDTYKDKDLLAANPPDERAVMDKPAAEITAGANADEESAQAKTPETPKEKKKKAEAAAITKEAQQ